MQTPPKSLKPVKAWPFIPGWLDDGGLTAAQFRVFCHIARRVNCHESLKGIAKCCRMKRETVQTALKDLLLLNVLVKEKRHGRTSILTLSPDPKWALGYRPTIPETGANPKPETAANHRPRNGSCEVTPSEVTPKKGAAPRLEIWKLSKDRARASKQIADLEGNHNPDRAVLRTLNREVAEIDRQLRELDEQTPRPPKTKTPRKPPTESTANSFAAIPSETVKTFVAETLKVINGEQPDFNETQKQND